MASPFIIAEISANHLGSLQRAMALIRAAAKAGADSVKFQCWTPGTMCVSDYVIESGPWSGRLLRDLYKECETPWNWFEQMFEHAREVGLEPFASAFDVESIHFLDELGVRRHKISSFELCDLELIKAAARTGKPLILSTGMATHSELLEAIRASYGEYEDRHRLLTLLHCVSGYPANPSEYNLSAMPTSYGYGVSDHTMGSAVAVAATALGATMIEKHLTLSRADGGPDSGFSMEPAEFAQMVKDVRIASEAMGSVEYGPRPSEASSMPLRRSLFWARTMRPGEVIHKEDIITARPATGLHPHKLESLIGKKTTGQVLANTPVLENHVS